MRKLKCLLLPSLCFVALASAAAAAEDATVREPSPQSQGVLFAKPLLSETEQADYRARIRVAKDEAERERIRSAHYELMKVRARERGYVLPENRPAATRLKGEAFGPRLTTEEERAAQRVRMRASREQSGVAIGPARREAAVEIARPVHKEQDVDSSGRAGEADLDASATAKAAPPSAAAVPTAAAPRAAVVLLRGIDRMFGAQLMTEEEKAAFRARLRRAKSDEERRAIRAERDQQLQARAKEKGVTLPQ